MTDPDGGPAASGEPDGEGLADTPPTTDGGYATGTDVVADPARPWGGRPRVRQLATLAGTEYRLAMRSRWALALVVLFAVFGTMLSTFAGSAVGPEGARRVVASLASLATYLVPLAALAFGYDAVVGRHEDGWLEVVVSLPVTRARVVVGTFLGRAAVLAGATVVGFGAVGALLLREYGTAHWTGYLAFLAGAVAVGAVFLALAVLVSTVAREKTHALGAALLVWVWFVLVHDLLALGFVAAFRLPDAALTALVLANPASVFRVLVLSQLGSSGGSGFAAVLAATDLSPGLLVAALLAWIVLPVAAAGALAGRRRL